MSYAPLRRFIRQQRPARGWIILSVVLASVPLLSQIVLLGLSGWFLAAMGMAGATGIAINYFTPAAIIRGLAMLRTGSRYGERLVTHDATLRMSAGWRNWFYARLETLAPSGLVDMRSADILTRMRNDLDRLERFFLQSLLPVLVSLVGVTVAGGFLWWVDHWLACGIIGLLLVAGCAVPLAGAWFARHASEAHADTQSQLRRALADSFHGLGELAIYGRLPATHAMLDALGQQLVWQEQKMHRIEALVQATIYLLTGIGMVWSVMRGAALVSHGMPATYLAALPLISMGCFELAVPMGVALLGFAPANAAAARIFAITERTPPSDGIKHVPSCEGWQLTCSLPMVEGRLRRPIHFQLSAPETLCLAGASASGKSSVVHWIVGLAPLPEGGMIACNGLPLAEAERATWRHQFAVAEQRPYLFTGTLADNLRIAAPHSTDEELVQACRIAHLPLAHFAAGLATEIGEHGMRLSGGEQRRLSVARAMLLHAQCLILDEPTEGLEPTLARAMMQDVLVHAAARGMAVITITHQPWLMALMGRAVPID